MNKGTLKPNPLPCFQERPHAFSRNLPAEITICMTCGQPKLVAND